MKILIGTPTGDGTICVQYFTSVRNLETRFRAARPPIASNVLFGSASFMPFSRNALSSIVLEDRSYSHLLFVDSDMGFAPEAVMRLIEADKDVIGCLYPKRTLDHDRFHRLAREIDDPQRARNVALDYAAADLLHKKVVQTPAGQKGTYNVENGLIRTLRLGMGLTLIRRSVFERMAELLPDLIIEARRAVNYHQMGLRGRVLQCFSSVWVDKLSMSEDLSFCHRWVNECGGEIWACVDQEIAHVGETTFRGRVLDRLAYEDEQVRSQS